MSVLRQQYDLGPMIHLPEVDAAKQQARYKVHQLNAEGFLVLSVLDRQ
jgi:hypothetical protein